MSVLRHCTLVLGVWAGMLSLPGQGWATTLTYTSDSIVEFDLFHQWWGSGGFLWTLPSEPAPAAWAKLHIEFDEMLDHSGSYSINRWGSAPAGHTLISDFTLSVETDRGHYEIDEFLYRDFELILETEDAGSSPRGTPAYWEFAWEFGISPSYSDHFWLKGANGSDQVAWLWEYYEHPEDIWTTDTLGGGDFTDGRLSVVQSAEQSPLAPVPLPAPMMFLVSGLAGLAGLRRSRFAGS